MRRLAALALALSIASCKDDPKPPPAADATATTPAASASAAPAATEAEAKGAAGTAGSAAPSASSQKAPDRIIVQHILISYKGVKRAKQGITRSKGEAKQLAEKVRGMAAAGDDDFTELVKRYSEDPAALERLGSTGWMKHGDMSKPFEDAAFALRVGELSPVVETPFGFHIIKRNQ